MKQRPNNPFTTIGYWGKTYFCDREDEMNWLRDEIKNERNVVLHSWRRMGKTALIQRFFGECNANRTAAPVHIDLMGTRNMKTAIRAITQGIYDRFGKTASGIKPAFQKILGSIGASLSFDPMTGNPQFQLNPAATPLPERSLEALGTFLESRKQQVIIALDEFQQITQYEEEAEAIFRGWMQQFPQIRFLFSGSHRKMMTSMFMEKSRPFYKSTQLMEIGPIPEKQYLPFIQRHFKRAGKTIGQDHVHEILQWSRGQTYSIQLLCNKLYGSCDQVKEKDLKRVQHEVIEQEKSNFIAFTHLLTDTQWELLKAVAKEELLQNPLSRAFIDRHNLGASSSVDRALRSLQEKEMIIWEAEGYQIHEVLLSRWLQTL